MLQLKTLIDIPLLITVGQVHTESIGHGFRFRSLHAHRRRRERRKRRTLFSVETTLQKASRRDPEHKQNKDSSVQEQGAPIFKEQFPLLFPNQA